MMKKICSGLLLVWLVQSPFYVALAEEQTIADCDPVVNIGSRATTLQKALSLLAEQYHFDLTFPVDADRPIEQIDSMSLSQALKYLTADVNTIFQYEKIPGCAKGRLIALEVLPVGEDTEYIYVKPVEEVPEVQPSMPPEPQPQPEQEPQVQAQDEPVYIENMELYAEEILLNQRQMDRNLAPEQRLELIETMNQVRIRLEAEGLLEPGSQNHNRLNRR